MIRRPPRSPLFPYPTLFRSIPASELARLATGQALMYIAAHGAARVTIPYLPDPTERTPRAAARIEGAFRAQLLSRPEYELPAIVQAQQQEFVQAWLQQLHALPVSDARPRLANVPPPVRP